MNKENIKPNSDSAEKPKKPASNAKSTKEDEKKKPETIITDVQLETLPIIDNAVIPEIISSDSKFETPEKINRPVTPIPIHRQPRSNLDTSVLLSPEHTEDIRLVYEESQDSSERTKS